ncbi:MAG: hypothetical protein E5X49_02040 [Mesorhizobium sp.]|uniref:hypothetical protein n=1 Tax=Mesorhizobium sp. TaxID=1871066 RepID=UPI0011F99439|nr:hypothetical protein [Mesorhizobium sp.]TIQ46364.1 MAG: hypothetical protein E5X49_02040 [Mesorhizobium sp.]
MPNVFNGSISRRNMLSGTAALTAGVITGGAAAAVALPAPPLSRQEKIKACIEQLNDLLAEETGLMWSIWCASDDATRYLGFDAKFKGLYDPTGIVGPPQKYGTPVQTYVCRREDGPEEGKVTRIPIYDV